MANQPPYQNRQQQQRPMQKVATPIVQAVVTGGVTINDRPPLELLAEELANKEPVTLEKIDTDISQGMPVEQSIPDSLKDHAAGMICDMLQGLTTPSNVKQQLRDFYMELTVAERQQYQLELVEVMRHIQRQVEDITNEAPILFM